MSSCLSGGSRTYGFDLDIVKAPTTLTRTSPASSSPSSVISESSNSPLSICTHKARTQRKRPNQTYNEAAALLSTAYPNIFPAKNLTNPRKSHKLCLPHSPDDSSELFLPYRVIRDESVFLNHHPTEEQNPSFFQIEPKFSPSSERSIRTPEDNEIQSKAARYDDDYVEDFDTESILDEEIEEGIIDSIMGDKCSSQGTENLDEENNVAKFKPSWSRNPVALLALGGRLDICNGFRRKGVSAWRDVGEVNWWNFPTVDVNAISPKLNLDQGWNINSADEKKKKKKKKIEKPEPAPLVDGAVERISNIELALAKEGSPATTESGAKKAGLILKLDYDNVLDAWSGRGSPFPDESPAPEVAGSDVAARLAQIDLFGEGGGTREASVQRYKEKRRTRLFSKKIRYQVRKLNADCRPRMKGRFVRRPNSKLIKDVDDEGIGYVPKPSRKK